MQYNYTAMLPQPKNRKTTLFIYSTW